MGYGIFQTDIGKWDNWIENGKYLIAYDDSDFRKLERKTIKKALEALESNTHLKFVKYDRETNTTVINDRKIRCAPGDPCNWYIKFQRSKKGFSAYIGRDKKAGAHNIQLLVQDGNQKPMTEINNYFYVVHEV